MQATAPDEVGAYGMESSRIRVWGVGVGMLRSSKLG